MPTRPPTDKKTVAKLLQQDLKQCVEQYGEAWFLSVQACWPGCSQHNEYIHEIEKRAVVHSQSSAMSVSERSTCSSKHAKCSIEVPKITIFHDGMDCLAWIEEVERVCDFADFAKPAWGQLAAACLDGQASHCWIAHKQSTSSGDSIAERWQWSTMKDYLLLKSDCTVACTPTAVEQAVAEVDRSSTANCAARADVCPKQRGMSSPFDAA